MKLGLAADDLCPQEFFATEAAFLRILMPFNLLPEFERAVGMNGYRQPASLLAQGFLYGAILGREVRRTVLYLSAAWGGFEKRNSLFYSLLAYLIPNSAQVANPTENDGRIAGLDDLISTLTRTSTFESGINGRHVSHGRRGRVSARDLR